jgi:hypothetical protein
MTHEIWYFVNLLNQASVALHERRGFVLHTTDFDIPGVRFEGGQSALCRLSVP